MCAHSRHYFDEIPNTICGKWLRDLVSMANHNRTQKNSSPLAQIFTCWNVNKQQIRNIYFCSVVVFSPRKHLTHFNQKQNQENHKEKENIPLYNPRWICRDLRRFVFFRNSENGAAFKYALMFSCHHLSKELKKNVEKIQPHPILNLFNKRKTKPNSSKNVWYNLIFYDDCLVTYWIHC